MKTTLEQWRMFKAVVDHGGYAQASDAIHKSQSTISYGVHKLQEQLGVKLLEVEGRKAVLTPHGRVLLQRAEQLLEQATTLDQVANSLSIGIEPVIRIAVDMIFPYDGLFSVLDEFAQQYPNTRIELEEFVLSGGNELLEAGKVDLLITTIVAAGWHGHHLERIRFIPVSHPAHPLQQLDRPVEYDDLTQYRQIVIRDSGKRRSSEGGWLGAYQRWTVTHASTSLSMVRRGLGYAWYPEHFIVDDLKQQRLIPLPFSTDQSRYVDLYLVQANSQSVGPATQALIELFGHDCQTNVHVAPPEQ